MANFYLTAFEPYQLGDAVPQAIIAAQLTRLFTAIECVKQGSSSQEQAQAIYTNIKDRVHRYGISDTFIFQRRLHILPHDIQAQMAQSHAIPQIDMFDDIMAHPNGAPLQDRMAYYNDVVTQVLTDMYQNTTEAPDHLIHATCSGYLSPSPMQVIANQFGWHHTVVTHSYHMGCYGAFPPLRMAAGFLSLSDQLQDSKNRVEIAHTELLSLHLDPCKHDAGHIINMTLFADGFIKYAVHYGEKPPSRSPAFRLLSMADYIIPDTTDEMTWIPGSYQFDMYLSKNIPTKIRDSARSFIQGLCHKANIDFEKEKASLIFAIHPGGPKILDHLEELLGLRPEQLAHSRDILFKNGNMSSSTIPYIWNEILNDDRVEPHTKVVTMAFGPGLTSTGFILEKSPC